MSVQRNLAPSVTPRPVKNRNGGPLGATSPRATVSTPANRGGRTYTASSPSPNKLANPFSFEVAIRPPEPTSSSATSPSTLRLRKKPLIISGDIRNLDSNFDIAMSRVPVTIAHVVSVFRKYDVTVSNDQAQTLIHEYEENNDRGLSYEPFVDDFVQLLRQNAMFKTASARLQAKKTRLAEHTRMLATMQSLLMDEILAALRDKLRVSWTDVRDAFRIADPDKKGRLSRGEFTRICTLLDVALPASVVDAFVVESDPLGPIDYNAFLTHFGSTFQHGDTNSVGFSLIYSRPLGGLIQPSAPDAVGNNTLNSPGVTIALNSKSPSPTKSKKHGAAATKHPQRDLPNPLASDPLYMEKLHIILNEKISSRHSDVKRAFMALDRDGNGLISATEFDQVLRDFNLVVSQDELEALLSVFDTNGDGSIDYHEFFAKFGDVMKPSAAAVMMKKQHMLENSSLVFGGDRDVKGANKNRTALSSPGNELKEAFSRLPDEIWRAIYVELDHSDAKKTGVVTSAEMLRVLAKYLGDLPKQHYPSLFRACGSHVNQLLNYRQLVKSYRQSVMDPVEYFHQDTHSLTEKTFRKSPTESLVMVWSIRVQRAQVPPLEWVALKEDLWRADNRRVGRIVASQFRTIVKDRLKLTDDQAAFLCFFYEDKNLTADQVTIRYGSFLTDYEDSGLEDADTTASTTSAGTSNTNQRRQNQQRTEGKGRVRPPGYGIHNSHHHGPDVDSLEKDKDDEEKKLRQFFGVNIRTLEAQLQDTDADKRGFVSLDQFVALCKSMDNGRFRENTRAFTSLVAKYIAQNHFYYRGFLLDFDTRVGLQAQSLVLQDDDDEDAGRDEDGGGDQFDVDGAVGQLMDVYQAREALRHHLTVSMSRQKVVYKLMQRMDPGKSGMLGYAELRRAFERLDITVDDDVARELCNSYEEEDESTGNRTGRVKYLLLLHAHGGRDPDKLDGMSDLSSNCSYYSAISISPRAVMKSPVGTPRSTLSRDHVMAARAVSNAIEKPRGGGGGGGISSAAAASAVERKIQQQLEAQGKKQHAKWKQLARAFQQIDSERRGAVSPSSFRKVLEDVAGVLLDLEDVVRLQLKYDIEQNGKLNYHEFLRHLTNAMSDLSSINEEDGATTLPTISSPRSKQATTKPGPGVAVGMSEALRQGVKAKWKAIYASLKTLDKQNVGRVSAAHFRQLLEWYALALADDEFLQLLRLFDHDDDGGVDYNKFMKACFA